MNPNTAYARGSKAWGICQRCGLRALLSELVLDGYYRDLRVHAECRDDRHPQERLPVVSDPQALWKPSPEQGAIAPVLSGVNVPEGYVGPVSISGATGSMSITGNQATRTP